MQIPDKKVKEILTFIENASMVRVLRHDAMKHIDYLQQKLEQDSVYSSDQ